MLISGILLRLGWHAQEECAFTHAEILGLKLLFALMDQVSTWLKVVYWIAYCFVWTVLRKAVRLLQDFRSEETRHHNFHVTLILGRMINCAQISKILYKAEKVGKTPVALSLHEVQC